MFFLNPANPIRFFFMILESLDINSIPVRDIKTKGFPVCVFYIIWEVSVKL